MPKVVPAIKIAPVSKEDFELLASIRVAAMRESLERVGRFDPVRSRTRLLVSFAPESTHLIVVDGKVAGFYCVQEGERGFDLTHFYILPEFQNQGTGSKVLVKILRAADRAATPVLVGALKGSSSNRFYRRHGFVPESEGEWDIYYVRPARPMDVG